MATNVLEPRRAGRQHGGRATVATHEINWKNPDDSELVAFIESQVIAHDARHLEWVRKARVQLAWASGDQLKIWDDDRGDLVNSLDVQADRIALFINRIKPAILNWISIITARPVSFRVSPATGENDDIASARVQDKLARYYWRRLLADTRFIDMLWMTFCTGCSFLYSVWDPNVGSEHRLGPSDLGIQNDDTAIMEGVGLRDRFRGMLGELMAISPEDAEDHIGDDGKIATFDGDLTCSLLTGFDIVQPRGAVDIPTAPWLIVRQYERIEELRVAYGQKAKDIAGGRPEPFSSTHLGHHSLDDEDGVTELGLDSDYAMTYELWRPDRAFVPGGHRSKICQGKVLVKGKNPYDHGEIPVVMVRELPSPKRFWPPSTVEDLMPIQAEINVTASQLAEHKASTIEPKILAERGIGLDEMAFTQRNEIVEVNPNKLERVKPWIPEPLPPYVPHLQASLLKDFEDVSRNHAPSYGKQASNMRSGKHVVALQEADARLNTPMLRMLKRSFSMVAKQWLQILHQFTDEARTTTIIGENHEPEVLIWSKHDLPAAEFNVECDLGPAIDRETTIQLIDTLTARGWLSPGEQGHREQVFRLLGEGVAHQIDESENDRRNAAMENTRLVQGMPATLSDGDDDTVHLDEHSRMQKSGQYRLALTQDPKLEEAFEIHKRAHERQRIMKRTRQEITQMVMQRDLMKLHGLVPQEGGESGAKRNGRGGRQSKGGQRQGKPSGAPNQGTYNPRRGKERVQGRRPPRLGTGTRRGP